MIFGNMVFLALCIISTRTTALEANNINETFLEKHGGGNGTLLESILETNGSDAEIAIEEEEEPKVGMPEHNDTRYLRDEKGIEYTKCFTHTTREDNVTSNLGNCYATYWKLVPVCKLTIIFTYEKPEEKWISGRCSDVYRDDDKSCRENCTFVARGTAQMDNETRVSLQCCCFAHNCNLEYETLITRHIQILDAERSKPKTKSRKNQRKTEKFFDMLSV